MDSFLTAHISSQAVADNLLLLRSRLAPGTKLCAVIKGDCYGHGIGPLLGTISAGADWLAVATGPEAIEVRDLGYAGPLLVLFSAGAYSPDDLDELVRRRLTLTVVADEEASSLSDAAARVGKPAEVHVMVDTGMTRSGVLAASAPKLIAQIRREPRLKLTGLYTHLATADEPDKSFAREQVDAFTQAVQQAGGRNGLLLHAANSAATIELPFAHLDMVRPGLSVFGYQPAEKMTNPPPLRPALKLTGPLMQVKAVPAGTRCGYGLTYRFGRPGVMGLVGVGYADGYLRNYSNRAVMQVRSSPAPVRGRVSMDQTIIDLTDIPDARVGDEVTIISDSPADPNSVNALALLAGTMPQEVTTRLGGRVRKLLVD